MSEFFHVEPANLWRRGHPGSGHGEHGRRITSSEAAEDAQKVLRLIEFDALRAEVTQDVHWSRVSQALEVFRATLDRTIAKASSAATGQESSWSESEREWASAYSARGREVLEALNKPELVSGLRQGLARLWFESRLVGRLTWVGTTVVLGTFILMALALVSYVTGIVVAAAGLGVPGLTIPEVVRAVASALSLARSDSGVLRVLLLFFLLGIWLYRSVIVRSVEVAIADLRRLVQRYADHLVLEQADGDLEIRAAASDALDGRGEWRRMTARRPLVSEAGRFRAMRALWLPMRHTPATALLLLGSSVAVPFMGGASRRPVSVTLTEGAPCLKGVPVSSASDQMLLLQGGDKVAEGSLTLRAVAVPMRRVMLIRQGLDGCDAPPAPTPPRAETMLLVPSLEGLLRDESKALRSLVEVAVEMKALLAERGSPSAPVLKVPAQVQDAIGKGVESLGRLVVTDGELLEATRRLGETVQRTGAEQRADGEKLRELTKSLLEKQHEIVGKQADIACLQKLLLDRGWWDKTLGALTARQRERILSACPAG